MIVPKKRNIGHIATKKYVEALDKLLNRFETPRDATVFRAVKKKDYAELLNSGVGTEFTLRGFVSSSTKKHIAEEFYKHHVEDGEEALLIEIQVPKGTPSFFIGSRSIHSNAYNEVELLLKRGLRYKIKSISSEKIIFEVISNEKQK